MKKLLTGLIFSILALTSAIVYVGTAPKVEAAYYSQALGTSIKNRVINGNMEINQRVSAIATSGGYPVDRFSASFSSGATLTWSQDTTVPTVAEAGRKFNKSIKVITSGATETNPPAAGDIISLTTSIEGYNISDVIGDGYNTGFTTSFWCRSSKTGTYCYTVANSAFTRTYTADFTVDVADTWEKKRITINAAPSGSAFDSTNGAGLYLLWSLRAGSDYNGNVNNSWNSTNDRATASINTSWAMTIGDTFYITGVQVESGQVATQFEQRPIAQELNFCMRYCEVFQGTAGSEGFATVHAYQTTGSYIHWVWRVTKRGVPAISYSAVANFRIRQVNTVYTVGAFNASSGTTIFGANDYTSGDATYTSGQIGRLETQTSSAQVIVDAEL